MYKEQNDKSGLCQQLISIQQHASNVMSVKEREKGKIEVPHKVALQSAALKLKLPAIKSNDERVIIQFNARDTSVKGL